MEHWVHYVEQCNKHYMDGGEIVTIGRIRNLVEPHGAAGHVVEYKIYVTSANTDPYFRLIYKSTYTTLPIASFDPKDLYYGGVTAGDIHKAGRLLSFDMGIELSHIQGRRLKPKQVRRLRERAIIPHLRSKPFTVRNHDHFYAVLGPDARFEGELYIENVTKETLGNIIFDQIQNDGWFLECQNSGKHDGPRLSVVGSNESNSLRRQAIQALYRDSPRHDQITWKELAEASTSPSRFSGKLKKSPSRAVARFSPLITRESLRPR
jgi:hypothetical protein